MFYHRHQLSRTVVWLTEEQMRRGYEHGYMVNEDAKEKGCQQRNGKKVSPERQLLDHVRSAQSEIAAQQGLGDWCFWRTTDRIGNPDLEDFIDVKLITEPHLNLLCSVDTKKDHWAYLLVHKWANGFLLVGWLWGHEMPQQRIFKKGRKPCYWREDRTLRDVRELRAVALKRRGAEVFDRETG